MENSKCVCNKGYDGDYCEHCVEGFFKVGDLCIPASCKGRNNLICNGNGDCIEGDDGNHECKCNSISDGRACM